MADSSEKLEYFLSIVAKLDQASFNAAIAEIERRIPKVRTMTIKVTGDFTDFDRQMRNTGGIPMGGGIKPGETRTRDIERFAKRLAEQERGRAGPAVESARAAAEEEVDNDKELRKHLSSLQRRTVPKTVAAVEQQRRQERAMAGAALQSDISEQAAQKEAAAKMARARLEIVAKEKYDAYVQSLGEQGLTLNKFGETVKMNAAQQRRFAEESGKVVKELGPMAHFLELMGKGQIRRGAAMGITEAFGGGPGAQFLGGIGGATISSLFLPVGWMIGNAIMQALGQALPEQERRQKFLAGALTPQERAKYEQIEQEERTRWAGSAAGWSSYAAGISEFQRRRVDPEKARQMMNQISAISGPGGGGGLARDFAEMMSLHTASSRERIVNQSPEIADALRKMFPNEFGKGTAREQRMQQYLSGGLIGNEDIETALRVAAKGGTESGRVARQVTDTEVTSKMSYLRRIKDSAVNELSEMLDPAYPVTFGWRFLKSGLGFGDAWRWATQASGGTAGAAGLGGGPPTGPFRMHPEPTGTRQAMWTSFAGLAEQMQMMWSGAPVDAMREATEKSAQTLGEIRQILDERLEKSGADRVREVLNAMWPA